MSIYRRLNPKLTIHKLWLINRLIVQVGSLVYTHGKIRLGPIPLS